MWVLAGGCWRVLGASCTLRARLCGGGCVCRGRLLCCLPLLVRSLWPASRAAATPPAAPLAVAGVACCCVTPCGAACAALPHPADCGPQHRDVGGHDQHRESRVPAAPRHAARGAVGAAACEAQVRRRGRAGAGGRRAAGWRMGRGPAGWELPAVRRRLDACCCCATPPHGENMRRHAAVLTCCFPTAPRFLLGEGPDALYVAFMGTKLPRDMATNANLFQVSGGTPAYAVGRQR